MNCQYFLNLCFISLLNEPFFWMLVQWTYKMCLFHIKKMISAILTTSNLNPDVIKILIHFFISLTLKERKTAWKKERKTGCRGRGEGRGGGSSLSYSALILLPNSPGFDFCANERGKAADDPTSNAGLLQLISTTFKPLLLDKFLLCAIEGMSASETSTCHERRQ